MSQEPITLYEYFRSSTSYRVRIALYLKGLEFKSVSVDLLKGEQKGDAFADVNPQGAVPYFIQGDVEIAQSQAIIEYLDEKYPDPALIFGSTEDKAYIRQMSSIISCEMHPFGNPSVWKGYLMGQKGFTQEEGVEWIHHWLHNGFKTYEGFLTKYNRHGSFTLGDQVSMADLCLMPQLYNARRFKMDLSAYPNTLKIEQNCVGLPAFVKAAPESHSDAPDDLEVIHGPQSFADLKAS